MLALTHRRGPHACARRHEAGGADGRGRLDLVGHLVAFDAHTPHAAPFADGSAHVTQASGGAGACAAAPGASLLAGGAAGSAGGGGAAVPGPLRRTGPGPGRLGGLELLEACLTGAPGGSRRLRDAAAHAGPVVAITACRGRVYTAGGRGAASSALLVWDAASREPLAAVTRRATQWLRSPVTALCAVDWGRVAHGIVGGPEAHLVSGHANGQVGGRSCSASHGA